MLHENMPKLISISKEKKLRPLPAVSNKTTKILRNYRFSNRTCKCKNSYFLFVDNYLIDCEDRNEILECKSLVTNYLRRNAVVVVLIEMFIWPEKCALMEVTQTLY